MNAQLENLDMWSDPQLLAYLRNSGDPAHAMAADYIEHLKLVRDNAAALLDAIRELIP